MSTRYATGIAVVAAYAAAAWVSALPASAQVPAGYPASYQQIIDAAKKEGKVAIFSSTNSPNTAPVWADFQKLYPGITVETTDLSSTELYNRFLSQDAAGAHDVDILWSNAMDLQMKLVQDGKALAYASPEKPHIPATAQYNDLIYGVTLDPNVIVYNKRLVPEALVPKTRDDLLRLLTEHRDMFNGKVTTYDVETTGSAYLVATYDAQRWPGYWNLVEAFGKVGTRYYQSAGTMVEMIAAGQYAIGYSFPLPYALFREQQDPNVGHVLPADYTLTLSRVAFIAKGGPHPNASKLFLDYLLSQRGQQLISDKGGLIAVRTDITGPATATEMQRQLGDKLIPIALGPSLVEVLEPRNRLTFLRRWKRGARGS